MSSDALSTKQFNTEHALLSQGNTDELTTRVRGVQNMTSNVYRPSFSSDYSTVHPNPSPARAGPHTGSGVMEDEDQE